MRIISIIIIIATLGLSGCGFHLRGTQTPYRLPFTCVIVAPDDPFNPVYKQLRHSLQAKKIRVISRPCGYNPQTDDSTGIPSITLTRQKLIEQPFAYGPDGEIRREKLTFELHYCYTDRNQTKMGHAATRRFRQLNSDQNLADAAEKILIEREMILDVVQQVLVQLTALTPVPTLCPCPPKDPYAAAP